MLRLPGEGQGKPKIGKSLAILLAALQVRTRQTPLKIEYHSRLAVMISCASHFHTGKGCKRNETN